jgi:diamine N-acetyltransferase
MAGAVVAGDWWVAMGSIVVREVTDENWRATLRLTVHPDQQRFVAESAPIAAIALAKAYIRPGGLTWVPYAISAGSTMVGVVALAYEPDTIDEYWIFHFFIDQHFQGRGYGKAALEQFIELVKRAHPQCQLLQLVVHPENHWAQRLYTGAGFRPTGTERWGEPVYQLALRDAAQPPFPGSRPN